MNLKEAADVLESIAELSNLDQITKVAKDSARKCREASKIYDIVLAEKDEEITKLRRMLTNAEWW